MGLIYNRTSGLFGIPSNVWSSFFVAFLLMNVLVSGVKVHCIVYYYSVDRGQFYWGRIRYMASIPWSLEHCLFSWVTRYWQNGSCTFCVVFNVLVHYFRMFLCMVFSMFSVWLPRCLTGYGKHVEQLRNIEIINYTTQLHLVGSFYAFYIMMHGSMNIKCTWYFYHSEPFSPISQYLPSHVAASTP
jgi:hypothetical protein